MKSSRNLPAMQLKVGTLIAIGLGVALLGLIFPTKGVNPLSPKITLVSYFPEVGGLRASSPVWFSGVEVGAVRSVEFVRDSNPPRLRVVMRVEKKIRQYLRADSRAEIRGMGLLGDMYIDLTQGSAGAEAVADGQELTGVPSQEFMDTFGPLVASAQGVLANLEQITGELESGQGALGRLLKDPALARELQDAVAELRRFMAELNRSDGSLHRFVTDPALYQELTETVREIRTTVAELRQAGETLLSEKTRQTIDETTETAARVVKRVGELQEKMDKIRFDLNFGLEKYEANVAGGQAELLIWPNDDRYYRVGIRKVSELYGLETEQTTFDAQLAWRILDTPLFIRGGLTRDEYFIAGLDLRLARDNLRLLLDAYRVELDPLQLDLRAGYVFLDLIELTAGAEDLLRRPFYKAGLTIHYRDDDLLNVLFKTVF